jgi:3-oxoacyl-[acyl-carrier protein] reductase
MTLIGKVALITGGSKGIGKAIALALAKEGVHPVIVARKEEDLQRTLHEIQALPEAEKYKLHPSYRVTDVTNLEAVKLLVQSVTEEYKQLDILVNNAGIYYLDYIRNVPDEVFASTIDINLKGVANITKQVLKVFDAQKKGMIVDIGSTASFPFDATTPVLDQNNTYAPTKWAHRTLSYIVEMEHPHVQVYRLHPSNTETEGRKDARSVLEKQIKKDSAFLSAEDVASIVIGLLKGKYEKHPDYMLHKEKDGSVVLEGVAISYTIVKKILKR